MTLVELKAAAYDSLVTIEFHKKRLEEINKAIVEANKAEQEKKEE